MLYDEPTALYRIWSHDHKALLYVGISCSWPRRMAEHIADKPWFPHDGVIEYQEYSDRDSALNAEAVAIRDEHPKHNIQHNGDTIRLRLRVEAEVEIEYKPGGIFATAAMATGGLLLLKWTADFLATWWVHRQGARQGVPVQVPPVVNPFTQDPPSALAQVFYLTMAASAAAQGDPELLKLLPQTGVARTIKAPQESPDDQISARSSAITHS
jgi:hypothetical protein